MVENGAQDLEEHPAAVVRRIPDETCRERPAVARRVVAEYRRPSVKMLASPRCKIVHPKALAVQGWDSHLWLVGSSATSCPQAIRLDPYVPSARSAAAA